MTRHRVLFALVALASLLAVVASAQSRAAAPVTPKRIEGRVLADGAPLPNVEVVASVGQSRARADRHVAVTDLEGRFTIDGLEERSYHIGVLAPPYVLDGVESPTRRKYRPGETVTLRLRRGGVITGKVLDDRDDPVVEAPVRAVRLRDDAGDPIATASVYREVLTDDRGVYRIFGLPSGSYIVSAGGKRLGNIASVYTADAPVYHPSATRGDAAEVRLGLGEEAQGVDIRYRRFDSFAVRGTLVGVAAGASHLVVAAADLAPSGYTSTGTIERAADATSFRIGGLTSGEYTVAAVTTDGGRVLARSAPQRIEVRGRDVAGVTLKLDPVGAIAGVVTIAQTGHRCRSDAAVAPSDVLIEASPATRPRMWTETPSRAYPQQDGTFELASLDRGRYRLDVRPPSPDLYVRSITRDKRSLVDGIDVAAGAQVGTVIVELARGAASVSGKVDEDAPRSDDDRYLLLLRLRDSTATDGLPVYETKVARDGRFSLASLPPGRYAAVVLEGTASRSIDETRARLQREPSLIQRLVRNATAHGQLVDLTPCESREGVTLSWIDVLPTK